MPLVQITATENLLTKQERDKFVTLVSDAVLVAEGADPKFPGAQALVWANYSETPEGKFYVAGKNIPNPPLIVEVTTPELALSQETRNKLSSDIGDIVNQFIGTYQDRLNHWAIFREVDEGSWAGNGQIFSLAGIQNAMNIKTA